MSDQNIEKIHELAKQLEEERKIPQFLLISSIGLKSGCLVRDSIDEFKRKNLGIDEIDIILESPGGSADWAYKIIRTFRSSFKTVNIVVPYWAKSAATLFALGGSNLIMNQFGELGPLDPQLIVDDYEKSDAEIQSALIDEQSLQTIELHAMRLYHKMYGFSAKNKSQKVGINRTILSNQVLDFVASFYQPLLSKIDPYSIGRKRRYLAVGESYATTILTKYSGMRREDINEFVDYLVNDFPDHGFVIDYDIVSSFLGTARKSSDISENYDRILTEISKVCVKYSLEDFIGFIPKKGAKEEDADTNKPKQKKRTQTSTGKQSRVKTKAEDQTNRERS